MFDPTLPQAGTEIDAVQMRGQFNGLKDLIDAIQSVGSATVDGVNTLPPGGPAEVTLSVNGGTLHFTFGIPAGADGSPGDAGPPFAAAVVDGVNTLPAGEQATVESSFDGNTVHLTFGIPQGPEGGNGADGPPFAQAVVDAVNTLDPWENATVAVNFDGSNVHFTFGIPRGNDGSNGADGAQGPPGSDGSQGPPGNDGAQGPPFAQAVVDGVTTLEPGENATVEVAFDGSQVHFSYGIPRGNDGNDGNDGAPGEVSFQQLADAIATTSSNSNGVGTLGMAVSDPPTQSEMQQIADKLDELINALLR
jgi:hypothetical protein